MTRTYGVDYVITNDVDDDEIAYGSRLVDATDEAAAERTVAGDVSAEHGPGRTVRITWVEEAAPVR